jgi:hypothetical protein
VSKISPGFQYLKSCPGHFIFFLLLNPNITTCKTIFIDLCQKGHDFPLPEVTRDTGGFTKHLGRENNLKNKQESFNLLILNNKIKKWRPLSPKCMVSL